MRLYRYTHAAQLRRALVDYDPDTKQMTLVAGMLGGKNNPTPIGHTWAWKGDHAPWEAVSFTALAGEGSLTGTATMPAPYERVAADATLDDIPMPNDPVSQLVDILRSTVAGLPW